MPCQLKIVSTRIEPESEPAKPRTRPVTIGGAATRRMCRRKTRSREGLRARQRDVVLLGDGHGHGAHGVDIRSHADRDQGDDRQQRVLAEIEQPRPGSLRRGGEHATGRQPVELECEQQDEEDAQPPPRNRK